MEARDTVGNICLVSGRAKQSQSRDVRNRETRPAFVQRTPEVRRGFLGMRSARREMLQADSPESFQQWLAALQVASVSGAASSVRRGSPPSVGYEACRAMSRVCCPDFRCAVSCRHRVRLGCELIISVSASCEDSACFHFCVFSTVFFFDWSLLLIPTSTTPWTKNNTMWGNAELARLEDDLKSISHSWLFEEGTLTPPSVAQLTPTL